MNDLLNSISRKSWKKNESQMEELSLRSSAEGLSAVRSDENIDIEKGSNANYRSEDDLNAFFKKEQKIRSEISNMQRAIQKLSSMNEEGKSLTAGTAIKAHSKKLEEEMKGVNLIASSIKRMLNDLMEDNKASCMKVGCGKGTSTYKIRQNATEDLKSKIDQRKNDFQDLIEKINEDEREITKRRYMTLTGETPDEKTLESLNTPEDRENLLRIAVQGQGKDNLTSFLTEMEERSHGVNSIIKELLSLQTMFLDMAAMVESQGKLLESIDSQVSRTVETVESGNTSLEKALDIKRGTRKWYCYLFILIIVIALVLGLIIYYLTK